jgi:GNAT superfamily N-acetyltransferase
MNVKMDQKIESHDKLKIRLGTPEDVHEVMKLALMVSDENGFLEPDPEKILHDVWGSLHRDKGLIGIIGEPGEPIEGGVMLRIGTYWYSKASFLEERVVFTHPDFRGAKAGRARRLCEFSKQTADALGLPLLIGVLSNDRTEAKVKLYERVFGKPAGAFFLHGARTGAVEEDKK